MSKKNINSPNTLLVLDWDGTIAATDTLSLIAPSPEALKPYTQAYMDDMHTLSRQHGERDTLPKMINWLDAMQDLEYASVKRVEDGGLFRGMPRTGLLQRAADTTLLDLSQGVTEFLKNYKGTWGVVSVGWSAVFIRKALEARGVDTIKKSDVIIRANEVEFDENGVGTGKISKHQGNVDGIRIARDKKREMERMVQDWRQSREAEAAHAESTVVYIGDSETDLMCLLEADVGFIINSPGMVEKCQRLGLEVQDFRSVEQLDQESRGSILYHIKDFRALLQA